jgi:hypothetical protein
VDRPAVAVFVLFPHQVHRGNLRFSQSFNVAGLSDGDVAVTENRLSFFVWNSERVKVRRESAAECMPASPRREVFVLLEQMAVSLVLILREFADAALLDRRLNHALRQIIEIHRLPCAALEDETDCERRRRSGRSDLPSKMPTGTPTRRVSSVVTEESAMLCAFSAIDAGSTLMATSRPNRLCRAR